MEAIRGDGTGSMGLREVQNTRNPAKTLTIAEPVRLEQPYTRSAPPLGSRSFRTAVRIRTWKKRLRNILPRIPSLFRFLQGSKPEVESLVDEMDKASSSAFPALSRG